MEGRKIVKLTVKERINLSNTEMLLIFGTTWPNKVVFTVQDKKL